MTTYHKRSTRSWVLVSVGLVVGGSAWAMGACAGKITPSPSLATTTQSRHAVVSATRTANASHENVSHGNVQPPESGAHRSSTVANGVNHVAAVGANGGTPVLARGRLLFNKHCVICHGEEGDGAGKFAYLMNPRPRNFKKGNFKLSTTQNQIPTDEDLVRTISRGMPGSAMPSWGHLPLADLHALAAYVRSFHIEGTKEMLESLVNNGTLDRKTVSDTFAARTIPGPQLVIPPEPTFDQIHWFRGRRLYLEGCASCHGIDGQPVADAVKFDEEGYPVPPRSFVNGIFKGGSDGAQLYARIWKGVKGTPMPASEGNYSSGEMWDLIHYVQSLARKGAQERAQLKQGILVATNVHGRLPSDPADPSWDQARPLYVALTPLWWTEQRVEGLVVQALHNEKELAIHISWIDPTLDDRAVRQTEFRDAVAIQFSMSSDPPFYMGDSSKNGGVNIWMWKADRQHDIDKGYQDVDQAFPDRVVDMYPEQAAPPKGMSAMAWSKAAITTHDPQFVTAWGAGNLVANPAIKTPVVSMVAHGPGTLSGMPANIQMVQGQAVYERGVWSVQLQRRMRFTGQGHDGERVFRKGDYLPVSFGIWNGSAGDRDGKKNISIWQKLVIE